MENKTVPCQSPPSPSQFSLSPQVQHYGRTTAQAQAIGLSTGEDYHHRTGEETQYLEASAATLPVPLPEGISPDDPHHGASPVGAVGARRAVAQAQGQAVESMLARCGAPRGSQLGVM